MSQPKHFEMLVLGSGEGGKYLAWHMAKSGHRTAVRRTQVDRRFLPNTKLLAHARTRFGARKLPICSPRRSLWIVTGPPPPT